MNLCQQTAKLRKWVFYGWIILLVCSSLRLLGALQWRFPLVLVLFDICFIIASLLLLLNQDNLFAGERDRVGAAIMLLSMASFFASFLSMIGGFDRQQAYFEKYFIKGTIKTEQVTSLDNEDGEMTRTEYHLVTENARAKKVLDVIHVVILAGTPFLLG